MHTLSHLVDGVRATVWFVHTTGMRNGPMRLRLEARAFLGIANSLADYAQICPTGGNNKIADQFMRNLAASNLAASNLAASHASKLEVDEPRSSCHANVSWAVREVQKTKPTFGGAAGARTLSIDAPPAADDASADADVDVEIGSDTSSAGSPAFRSPPPSRRPADSGADIAARTRLATIMSPRCTNQKELASSRSASKLSFGAARAQVQAAAGASSSTFESVVIASGASGGY